LLELLYSAHIKIIIFTWGHIMVMSQKDFEQKARPLAQSLLDYGLKEGSKYGITDVAVSVVASDNLKNSVEKGDVTAVVLGEAFAVSVNLYAGDKLLSFGKNTLDKDVLKETMLDNMKVIHLVPSNPHNGLLESSKLYKGTPQDLDLLDPSPASQQDLIDYAKTIEAEALKQPNVKTTRSTSASRNVGHQLMLATNGLDRLTSKSMHLASSEVIAEDNSGMQVDYDYSYARHFSDMADPKEVGKNAGQNAAAKLSPTLPKTGKMPVILSQDAAEVFFGSVLSAIDGTAVYRETTFLKDQIGSQVMSKGVTIIDDPGVKRGMSSNSVDSAGQKSDKLTVIKDGVLKTYYVDVEESRQLGIDTMGRNDGAGNLTVLPGDVSPDELMADIKEGVYIKGFNGGKADVNTGIYSRPAYGLLIKDGKLTDTPLDGFVVSGNLKDMFMNIVLADDTPAMPNPKYDIAAPKTRINGLTIAGQ
jgi:PmbA protein